MSQAMQGERAVTINTAGMPRSNPWTGREGSGRRRTPLSLVAPIPVRRRIPFTVFCCTVLVIALAALMMINISVSSGQYKLVQLSNQQSALQQRNQALTQQAEYLQAPQHLASEASELGMVASPSFGFVDLENGKVTGNPVPAVEDEDPAPALPQADTGNTGPALSPDGGAATEQDSEGALANGETASEDATALQDGAGSELDKPQALNSGTVPAPEQKTGR